MVRVAQTEAHAAIKKGHLGSVLPAWIILFLGFGCSGGLLGLEQQKRHDLVAANGKQPVKKPDPAAKDCQGCSYKCKCVGGKCDCPAETEDSLKKRVHADIMIPPNTDVGISAFGHPWARADRL